MSESEQPKKNHKKLIILIITIAVIIPASMYVFDSVKSPLWLYFDIDQSKFENGYEVVCDTKQGMSLCILQHNDSNQVKFNQEKLVIQRLQHSCLNVYLHAGKKTMDSFNELTNSTTCSGAIEFTNQTGWTYNQDPLDSNRYFASSIKQFWKVWWYDL